MTGNKKMEIKKRIGICAHSYEGGSLCFITTCREGATILGAHMHPTVIMSAIPMGLSMNGWETNNYEDVATFLSKGVEQVAMGGANFFICPDNTGHIVLERIIDRLPIPGLHIADVVCSEILTNNWTKIGLLGTKWTMTGEVYSNALKKRNLTKLIPTESLISQINDAIFEELCQGIFTQETIRLFQDSIELLKQQGAECVILGCTEISLIINSDNSALPVLDTTRLLAKYAVKIALSESELPKKGWISII
jgi:aspartate racemase